MNQGYISDRFFLVGSTFGLARPKKVRTDDLRRTGLCDCSWCFRNPVGLHQLIWRYIPFLRVSTRFRISQLVTPGFSEPIWLHVSPASTGISHGQTLKIIQIGPRLYNVLSNEKFADGLSEKAKIHEIFGKQISTVWKPKYSPWKIHSTFEVFFLARERYESNFLGPLTAGFGNGCFRYQSWEFTSLKKRENKGLKWWFNEKPIPFSDRRKFSGIHCRKNHRKLTTESLFVSPTWSPPISFCCRQSRGWTARCWNICYLAAFWQAIEVGQVSRSQVVGFLKHQQLGDETLLKLDMGNCDESWRDG